MGAQGVGGFSKKSDAVADIPGVFRRLSAEFEGRGGLVNPSLHRQLRDCENRGLCESV